MIARVALAAAALLACAWFVLGIRQAHDTDAATAIVQRSSNLTATGADHADSLVHGASVLNPDQTVNILRGEIAVERGRLGQAQRILGDVTRAEPQNLQAWVALAGAYRNNGKEFLAAVSRVRKLDPANPAHH